MAQTKAQIRDRALRMLGKLAIGANAVGEIADDIENAYDQVYEDLKSKGLVTWLSASVPDQFVEDVASIVAINRSEGIPSERFKRIFARASVAELNISSKISGRFNNSRNVEIF